MRAEKKENLWKKTRASSVDGAICRSFQPSTYTHKDHNEGCYTVASCFPSRVVETRSYGSSVANEFRTKTDPQSTSSEIQLPLSNAATLRVSHSPCRPIARSSGLSSKPFSLASLVSPMKRGKITALPLTLLANELDCRQVVLSLRHFGALPGKSTHLINIPVV